MSMLQLHRLLCDLDAAASRVIRRARELDAGSEFFGAADEFARRVEHARQIEEQALRLAQDPETRREAEEIAEFLAMNGRPRPASLRWALQPTVTWSKPICLSQGDKIWWKG